jgi:hypothetical protein
VENSKPRFKRIPLTDSGRAWIDRDVSREGFQPYWPTVIIEARYLGQVLDGIVAEGFLVVAR